MTKKFGILRFIGTIYKILGVIFAVIAIGGAIASSILAFTGGTAFRQLSEGMGYNLGAGELAGSIFGALIFLIGFGIAAIGQFAIGEAIFLFLAIEENTRATAGMLAHQTREVQPPATTQNNS